MVKLPRGGYANYAAITGAGAPRAARIFDATLTNLDYSGGPVMPSNTNYAVEWQPSNYTSPHTPFQPNYVSGVNQFFTDLAAASGQSTNSDAVSSQYNDSAGNTAAYHSTFGGNLIDTDPLPANGCPVTSSVHICLTDAQLQTELDSFLTAQGLPHDLSHAYFLLTPPDVASCIDSAGTICSANADQNLTYCAYHGVSSAGFIYANIPDLTGSRFCDPFVASCPNSVCAYDNGPADGVLSSISHEHNESITDPQPNNAWTDWGSGVGGEIGNKCEGDEFRDPNVNLQDNGSGTDTPYNQTINGRHYLLQREWSNQTVQCLDSFTPNGTTVSASFTQSGPGSPTVSFDASPSTATGGVAHYVWQFDDGPGQTSTIETTSPTITHTFAQGLSGYLVGLTVMAGDGTSSGAGRPLTVGDSSPTAAFTTGPPSPLDVNPVVFDAAGTSDSNPGASISSYSWSFGDGATATGSTPSHRFAPGAFPVGLTVTDSLGWRGTTVNTVTVTDESPSASFARPSATVGFRVDFGGSASDPDGAITAYSWSFGDGGTATAPSVSHVYASAGTYTATLTITDSSGHSASVSHVVIVLPSCVVPKVRGLSLALASRALTMGHCRVGPVSKPRHKPSAAPGKHQKWALVAGHTSPGAGRVEPNGTRVKLVLVYKVVRK